MGRSLVVFMCLFHPVAVLSPNSASCAVSEQRMEIQDLSDKGSPIQISGYMAIRYDSENRFPFFIRAEHVGQECFSQKVSC